MSDIKQLLKKMGYECVEDINKKSKSFPYFTDAGRLASEGQDEDVEKLWNFGASVNDIAEGYAYADKHEDVEFYHNKRYADVNYIARGYAKKGNHKKVEYYHTNYNASVNYIVQGYAEAGAHDEVKHYLEKHGANVDFIIEVYACRGDHEKVEDYLENYGTRQRVSFIIQFYARVGNYERAEHFRKKYDRSFDDITNVYKELKNHKKVAEYTLKSLLDDYITQRSKQVTKSGEPKKYLHSSIFALFQKSYEQKEAAVTALKAALNGENVDLSIHSSTLKNGELGKRLQKYVDAHHASCLVGQRVRTVSNFIKVYQKDIDKKYGGGRGNIGYNQKGA